MPTVEEVNDEQAGNHSAENASNESTENAGNAGGGGAGTSQQGDSALSRIIVSLLELPRC